jgi:ketosteroid isomerase-like protein
MRVSDRELAIVQKGLRTWQRGDFGVVESLLDPAATWHWFEPGEWDCENREQVVERLRERYEQGFGRGRTELVDAGPGTIIAISWPREIGGAGWPEETATVLSFRDERIVSMQDYRTRDEALAALSSR